MKEQCVLYILNINIGTLKCILDPSDEVFNKPQPRQHKAVNSRATHKGSPTSRDDNESKDDNRRRGEPNPDNDKIRKQHNRRKGEPTQNHNTIRKFYYYKHKISYIITYFSIY